MFSLTLRYLCFDSLLQQFALRISQGKRSIIKSTRERIDSHAKYRRDRDPFDELLTNDIFSNIDRILRTKLASWCHQRLKVS